jgi:hypothetical protein
VLRLCAAAGLVTVGTVAIDGTKIGSDAALDQNRGAEWIRREVAAILADARQSDQTEHDQPGLYALDELPAALSTATGRLARLEQAAALIEARDAAAAAQAEQHAAKARTEAAEGRKLPGRKPKDPHAALARAQADETAVRVKARAKASPAGDTDADIDTAVKADPAVQQAAAATATARTAAKAATTTSRANITDPQSRIMKTADGWVQGYNVQAACGDGTPAAHRARCGRLRETVPPRRARLRYQGQPQLPTVPAAAASRQPKANGRSWPPRTTSASSTDTTDRSPEPGPPHHHDAARAQAAGTSTTCWTHSHAAVSSSHHNGHCAPASASQDQPLLRPPPPIHPPGQPLTAPCHRRILRQPAKRRTGAGPSRTARGTERVGERGEPRRSR